MQQDENQLLRSIYENYSISFKKFAISKGVDYDDAEDVIQETVLSYYENYPLDWPENKKRAMLLRILYGKCVDLYRKNRHYQSISIDEPIGEIELLSYNFMRDSLDDVIGNETFKEVRKCIEGMKKNWRDVVILCLVEGRTTKEVCEILGIAETVCRSRVSRARKYLREKFGDSYRF